MGTCLFPVKNVVFVWPSYWNWNCIWAEALKMYVYPFCCEYPRNLDEDCIAGASFEQTLFCWQDKKTRVSQFLSRNDSRIPFLCISFERTIANQMHASYLEVMFASIGLISGWCAVFTGCCAASSYSYYRYHRLKLAFPIKILLYSLRSPLIYDRGGRYTKLFSTSTLFLQVAQPCCQKFRFLQK